MRKEDVSVMTMNDTESLVAGQREAKLQDQSLGRKIFSASMAMIFASIIIGAVGFAPGYAHNAAHDTRHVMVFPCH